MAELSDLLRDVEEQEPLEEDMLTVKEVASYLKVSENTVYNYLNKGELNGVKVGRSWRITRESIRTYLTRNTILRTAKKG